MVDCSHANSWKKPELQPLVMRDVVHQIREGNRSVVGLMVESFLEPGSQPIPQDLTKLRYGCSVTDPCVGWDTTVEMLHAAREMLRPVLPSRDRHGAGSVPSRRRTRYPCQAPGRASLGHEEERGERRQGERDRVRPAVGRTGSALTPPRLPAPRRRTPGRRR